MFRGLSAPHTTRLKSLLGHEELLLGDLILAEILQGTRSEVEAQRVDAAFAPFRVVPLVGEAIARSSAHRSRELRARGVTVSKTIDCLIAT